jgi:F1F0 ATPase subunit 2
MMIEMLLLALLFGVILGITFFFGLWWTVRKGLGAENPVAWFLISFLLRILMVIMGFYWTAQIGQWQHIVMALLGFVITRMILTRWASNQRNVPPKETEHAS